MEEIVNKVAQSGLISLDLESLRIPGERVQLDIKQWLFQAYVLREKEFRAALSQHDWTQYQDQHVAITCSNDAIVPTWAYMLIALQLQGIAQSFHFGDLEALETELFRQALAALPLEEFQDARVVVKGCSKQAVPMQAYVAITELLKPKVKSLFFGEPCSTVPLFKRK